MVVGDALTAGVVDVEVGTVEVVAVVDVVEAVVVRAVVVSAVVVGAVVVSGTVVTGSVGTVPVGIVVVVVTPVDEPVVVSRNDPRATTDAASAPRAPSATSAITGRARRSTMGHGSNGPQRNPLANPLESG